jgi:HD-like signal output (HDOD) protein
LAQWKQQPDQSFRSLEQELLETDHLQAGEWLARRWHLPEAVVQVIGCFDDGNCASQYGSHRCIVTSASKWVNAYLAKEGSLLSASSCLQDKLGLGSDLLEGVEEQYREQSEKLHAVTRMLFPT